MNKKQRLKELKKVINEKQKGINKFLDERNKIQTELKEEGMKKIIGKCFVYSYFDEDYDENRRKIFNYSKVVGIKYGMYCVIEVSKDIHGNIIIMHNSFGESYFGLKEVKEISNELFNKKFNEMMEELNKEKVDKKKLKKEIDKIAGKELR